MLMSWQEMWGYMILYYMMILQRFYWGLSQIYGIFDGTTQKNGSKQEKSCICIMINPGYFDFLKGNQ